MELSSGTGQVGTPLWDELAAGLLAYPELITEARTIYIDMDTSYGSRELNIPTEEHRLTQHSAAAFYGRTIAAIEGYQPPGSRNVTYVTGVNSTHFKSLLVKAVQGVYSN